MLAFTLSLCDVDTPLERLSVDHRKPAPGSAEFLAGRSDTAGTEAALAPVPDVPQTEFRAGRFNVGAQLQWLKSQYDHGPATVDMDTVDQGRTSPDVRAFPLLRKPTNPSFETRFPAYASFLETEAAAAAATATTATAATAATTMATADDDPRLKTAGLGKPEFGDILPCGKPPELKGQSLRVCVPFGGPLATDLLDQLNSDETQRGEYDALARAQQQRRFGGATPPVVVLSIETSSRLPGRFVANLVAVFFDHFEVVVSRIDAPWSFDFTRGSTAGAEPPSLWLDWYAYGFRLPQKDEFDSGSSGRRFDAALAAHQRQADATYNDPLRSALSTLPQQVQPLDMLNPQTHLDPFVPEARDNPLSARHAFGAVDGDVQDPNLPTYKGMHGFDSEAVAATERADCDRDTRLAQSRTYQGYLAGIQGAPGYQPTPAWAKLAGSEKGMARQGVESSLKTSSAATGGSVDTQQELPMPWRPKLDPRRDDADGGFFTGEAKQGASAGGAKAAPATDGAAEERALERSVRSGALTGFAPLELADGEGGVVQASWARAGRSRPVLWRAGPGADSWPEWCTLRDARAGTVACNPPLHTPPGDHVLNVTAVWLDAVDGLSQEVFRATIAVLPRTVVEADPGDSYSS